ncbi:hypothetical protein Unana1_03495 [Umbelopsis nana]
MADEIIVIHDASFEEFRKWLGERGFPKSKITLAEFEETGRGMMATVDLEPGDTLVSVPRNILITAAGVAKKLGAGHHLDSNQLLVLEICNLKRQGSKSSWWPYVNLLPNDFDTMPVTYPDHVLKSAVPAHMAAEVQEQRTKIDADFQQVLQYLKTSALEPADLSYREFEWAWLCVNTRSIHLGIEDKSIIGGNIALAPMLDFLNHKSDAQFECGYNIETNSFDIRTLMPYRRGQQLPLPRRPDEQALYEAQNERKVWGSQTQDAGRQRGQRDYTIRRTEISFRTLSALRLVMAADKSQCSAWQRVVLGSQDTISPESELQVGLLIGDMCRNITKSSERALQYLKASGLINANPRDFHTLESPSDSDASLHPFALLFLNVLWREYATIAQAVQTDLIPVLSKTSTL